MTFFYAWRSPLKEVYFTSPMQDDGQAVGPTGSQVRRFFREPAQSLLLRDSGKVTLQLICSYYSVFSWTAEPCKLVIGGAIAYKDWTISRFLVLDESQEMK